MPRIDVPDYLIQWLSVDVNGVLHWISEQEASGFRAELRGAAARKIVPFGQPVTGTRPIHGHGVMLALSNRRLLSVDAIDAIADGGRWPWEAGKREPRYLPGNDDQAALDVIHKTWKLEGGAIVWAITVGDGNEAGQVARGTMLSGPRGTMITRSGTGYLSSDVNHALVKNCFPWA
jgi:hypothetical protein